MVVIGLEFGAVGINVADYFAHAFSPVPTIARFLVELCLNMLFCSR